MRCTVTLAAVLAMVTAFSATAGTTFSDPTSINILERWNPDGSYYYAQTTNTSHLWSRAQWYKSHVSGLYGGIPSEGVIAKIEFDKPMQLDHLTLLWRDIGHTPTSWEIHDQNGLIVADTRDLEDVEGFLRDRLYTIDPLRAPSTYLEFRSSNTSIHKVVDMLRFGAYLAPGKDIVIDGTYNVFRQEVPKGKMSVKTYRGLVGSLAASDFDTTALTDGEINGFNCYDAGAIEWTFSQPYTFTGGLIAKYEDFHNVMIKGLTLEVWDDVAEDWITVYTATTLEPIMDPDTGLQAVDPDTGLLLFDPIPGTNSGFLVFTQQATGSKVRMSWLDTGGGGGREITEFQLFGRAIPEPVTVTLLALGGLALLRRRR